VVALRLEFVEGVTVRDVKINDILNTADAGHWLCGEKYRLPGTFEMIEAKQMTLSGDHGADTTGIAMATVDGVVMESVSVTHLESMEGATFGIQMRADTNDRRDAALVPATATSNPSGTSFMQQVDLQSVIVEHLIAGAGRAAIPIAASLTTLSTTDTATATDAITTKRQRQRNRRVEENVRCLFSDRDLHSRMPLVSTSARFKLLHACDQCHSSQVFTPLTG
jgi:hypothetical protein